MTKVTYEIVEHDGGWAYRVETTYSETYPTREEARSAAERAAREQAMPGESGDISWEDERGRWHTESSDGQDRPDAEVTEKGDRLATDRSA